MALERLRRQAAFHARRPTSAWRFAAGGGSAHRDDPFARVLAALGLVHVIACTAGGTEMDPGRLREFATGYTAAWNSQDAARVGAFYSERGSLTVNDGQPAVGREAITGVARGFMTAFPDMVVVMDSLRTAGSTIEYHWTFAGTNTGPGGTGHAVRFSGYEEWTLGEDGLITASLGHFDAAAYRRQLESGGDGT